MFRQVNDAFWTSPQIQPEDVAAAAAQGVRAIINNRPDFEEPGQPLGAAIQAQAEALGLAYVAAPVRGAPGPEQIAAMRATLDSADGPVLAFCKSGTRSVLTWAAAEIGSGARSVPDVVALAHNAGYDISRWV